jgi:hypothetical protein
MRNRPRASVGAASVGAASGRRHGAPIAASMRSRLRARLRLGFQRRKSIEDTNCRFSKSIKDTNCLRTGCGRSLYSSCATNQRALGWNGHNPGAGTRKIYTFDLASPPPCFDNRPCQTRGAQSSLAARGVICNSRAGVTERLELHPRDRPTDRPDNAAQALRAAAWCSSSARAPAPPITLLSS